MSQSSEIQGVLRQVTLFREFTDEELSEFLDLLDPIDVKAGDRIVRQDEVGDCMYLLVKGHARVVHHKDGRDVELAMLKGGDFFGEIALVDHGPRSADVEATEPCQLLQISQASIAALAGVYPAAAFKFLIAIGRIMVERLRQSNQRYVDSMLFPLQGKD
jgi:CRP/FNR family cyclic AMP-dependent transcriptional regulator